MLGPEGFWLILAESLMAVTLTGLMIWSGRRWALTADRRGLV